jgi:hypothetical protein
VPPGALAPEVEEQLLACLTDVLIVHEGAGPTNQRVRSIAWVFLHRPAAVYVAGSPAEEPRHRFIASVPEGQFDADRRQVLVGAITDAMLDAAGARAHATPVASGSCP